MLNPKVLLKTGSKQLPFSDIDGVVHGALKVGRLAGTGALTIREASLRSEGFRIVGRRGSHWDVRRLSRKTGEVWVPKVGWVRFRWSRPFPDGVRSFRMRRDRAGRWHVCFAVIPPSVGGPGMLHGGVRLQWPGL